MRVRGALRQTESGFLAGMLYEAIFIPEGHGPLPKEAINIETIDIYVNKF